MEKTIEDFQKELLQEQIYTAKKCAEEVVKQEAEMDREFKIQQKAPKGAGGRNEENRKRGEIQRIFLP